jgi:hypothetical protein
MSKAWHQENISVYSRTDTSLNIMVIKFSSLQVLMRLICVPQNAERLFLLGCRKGFKRYQIIAQPTHSPAKNSDILPQTPTVPAPYKITH